MTQRRMIPCLYLDKSMAVAGFKDKTPVGDVEELVRYYNGNGADGLLLFDVSSGDADHEETISQIREICQISEIPVLGAGNISRAEDVKKLIYAGCAGVILGGVSLLEEVSKRFGKERIGVSISEEEEYASHQQLIEEYAGFVLGMDFVKSSIPVILYTDETREDVLTELLKESTVAGITGPCVSALSSLHEFKETCRQAGIPVKTLESAIPWEKFKLNSDGLIPVVVQDYKTSEVLMVAYMNQEAFKTTLKTGKMTYWSRSRQELWIKGMTSGHFQYVKSLTLDCDNDTILAKVDQIGAACHTGNRSCFFQPLIRKEYSDKNPLTILQSVYEVILDRREHPREGSYTNYLFDKGIDKILKKVGEECAEIIIAAKNPDPQEVKYEISDFLYHLMVLMAEKGVTWEDITGELSRR